MSQSPGVLVESSPSAGMLCNLPGVTGCASAATTPIASLFPCWRSLHPVFSLSCSSSCVPSRFLKLSQSIILEGGQALPIAPDVPLAQAVHVAPAGVPVEPAPRPRTAVDPTAELILLQPPQVVAWVWVGVVCWCCDTRHLGHREVFLLSSVV